MAHQPPAPIGLYEPFATSRNLVAVSAISSVEDGAMITGQVGFTLDANDCDRGRPMTIEERLFSALYAFSVMTVAAFVIGLAGLWLLASLA
jgi:hypothetical protein